MLLFSSSFLYNLHFSIFMWTYHILCTRDGPWNSVCWLAGKVGVEKEDINFQLGTLLMEMTVFWDIVPCFRGVYCHCHQSDGEVMHLWNIHQLRKTTQCNIAEDSSSYFPLWEPEIPLSLYSNSHSARNMWWIHISDIKLWLHLFRMFTVKIH
jgi:hypothetical protein